MHVPIDLIVCLLATPPPPTQVALHVKSVLDSMVLEGEEQVGCLGPNGSGMLAPLHSAASLRCSGAARVHASTSLCLCFLPLRLQVVGENHTVRATTQMTSSRLPGDSGGGSVAAMSENDGSGTGGGGEIEEDDNTSRCGCKQPGAPAQQQQQLAPSCCAGQTPLDTLYTEPQEVDNLGTCAGVAAQTMALDALGGRW